MDFGFSQEQEMLRNSARDFLAKECPMTYVRQMMEDDRGFRDAFLDAKREAKSQFADWLRTASGLTPRMTAPFSS